MSNLKDSEKWKKLVKQKSNTVSAVVPNMPVSVLSDSGLQAYVLMFYKETYLLLVLGYENADYGVIIVTSASLGKFTADFATIKQSMVTWMLLASKSEYSYAPFDTNKGYNTMALDGYLLLAGKQVNKEKFQVINSDRYYYTVRNPYYQGV